MKYKHKINLEYKSVYDIIKEYADTVGIWYEQRLYDDKENIMIIFIEDGEYLLYVAKNGIYNAYAISNSNLILINIDLMIKMTHSKKCGTHPGRNIYFKELETLGFIKNVEYEEFELEDEELEKLNAAVNDIVDELS